jgi:hypothetical protein
MRFKCENVVGEEDMEIGEGETVVKILYSPFSLKLIYKRGQYLVNSGF